MLKSIIFDFDGVIVETYNMCFNLTKENYPDITEKEFKERFFGNFWENATSSEKKLSGIITYEKRYKNAIDKEIIHPIMFESLKKLNDKYKLFIISSGGENNLKYFLKKNNILHFFEKILGRDTHFSKIEKFNMVFNEYNLTSNDCIFITDTLGDILEAKEVNLKSIAVTWGFHEMEILNNGNPHKIIHDYDELLPSIENH